MTGREYIKSLWLPFESVKTVYNGPSEVRLYRNQVTDVLQIGKRVSALGVEEAAVFREAKVLQSINHPHVVPVYDVAVVEQTGLDSLLTVIEMIMPYYESGSVFDALQNGRIFSIGDAVRLTRDALVGLSELHEEHGLLHRDMKSPNVFLDDDGRIRVGDLGVAIPMNSDGSAEAFNSQQIYTAPEIFTTRRCDRRTDIYGIGLVMLEMLSGALPYDRYTPAALQKRLSKGQRAVAAAHLSTGPHVSPRLRRIVNKAISVDPTARFGNAREMIDALDQAPFIDWRVTSESDERIAFEGESIPQNRRYRVEATKRRRGQGWKLTGRRHITSWRRCIPDQDVDDPRGVDATAFFDQLVKQACNR